MIEETIKAARTTNIFKRATTADAAIADGGAKLRALGRQGKAITRIPLALVRRRSCWWGSPVSASSAPRAGTGRVLRGPPLTGQRGRWLVREGDAAASVNVGGAQSPPEGSPVSQKLRCVDSGEGSSGAMAPTNVAHLPLTVSYGMQSDDSGSEAGASTVNNTALAVVGTAGTTGNAALAGPPSHAQVTSSSGFTALFRQTHAGCNSQASARTSFHSSCWYCAGFHSWMGAGPSRWLTIRSTAQSFRPRTICGRLCPRNDGSDT